MFPVVRKREPCSGFVPPEPRACPSLATFQFYPFRRDARGTGFGFQYDFNRTETSL